MNKQLIGGMVLVMMLTVNVSWAQDATGMLFARDSEEMLENHSTDRNEAVDPSGQPIPVSENGSPVEPTVSLSRDQEQAVENSGGPLTESIAENQPVVRPETGSDLAPDQERAAESDGSLPGEFDTASIQ